MQDGAIISSHSLLCELIKPGRCLQLLENVSEFSLFKYFGLNFVHKFFAKMDIFCTVYKFDIRVLHAKNSPSLGYIVM